MEKFTQIQFVIACISTHSCWLRLLTKNFDVIDDYFHLSATQKLLLRDFFVLNHQKIWTSAVLMEERRWREVLPTLSYTKILFGVTKLKTFWHAYLKSFTLNQCIPVNPASECIAFLNFILKKDINKNWSHVLAYELLKRQTYNQPMSLSSDDLNTTEPCRHLRVHLNPTLTVKIFPFIISKVLPNLAKGKLPITPQLAHPEYIAFYKANNQTVKILALNHFTQTVVSSIQQFERLGDWIDHQSLHLGLSKTQSRPWINHLIEQKIIFLNQG